MRRDWLSFKLFWLCFVAAWAPSLAAQESEKSAAAESRKFIRVDRDEAGEPKSLDTAIVRYEPKNGENPGLTVDLVGAVHIGEKSYYEQLNKAFEDYDVLLYELVAPEGTRVPKGGGESSSPISSLQQGMKDFLELEFQLAYVDYNKDNFVHADMSPEQFAKSMRDRGESIWTIIFRMMGQGIAQQSKGKATSDFDVLLALFDKNRALKMKRILAVQFEDLDTAMDAFEGPDGSTLITERNKAALAVLKKQIASGKKRIGIFYGAGHLADMEERLVSDFGLEATDQRWLVAWDLHGKDGAAKAAKPKRDR